MCGIAGIIHFSSQKADKKELKKMCDAIAHRGPDAEGFYLNKNVAFGHRRLSILELTKLGKQPMFSKNKRFVISYNGEIYNYLEIKEVIIDSPAYRFGLLAGDIIISIDDNDIQVVTHVIEVLWERNPGDQIIFKVYRNNEYYTFDIVLGTVEPVETIQFYDTE